MDKFYVVGITMRGRVEHPSQKVYGDALVYASDKHKALTMVRNTGWVPNPGDIHLLGGEYYNRWLAEDYSSLDIELAKEKAREEGVAILWKTGR